MTLLLIDGFDDGLQTFGRWGLPNGSGTTTGRLGTGLASTKNVQKQIKPADETDTIIVGFAFKWDGGDNREVLSITSDGGTTPHQKWMIRSSGQIQCWKGGTLLGTTLIANPLIGGVWHYMEVKTKLHSSTGTVECRMDEVTVLSLTAQNTKNGGTKTTWDNVQFNTSSNCTVDDIYIANNVAVGLSDFAGDLVVEALLPTGNGNSSVLMGSDGNSVNNYLLINESTPDSTSYVGSVTTGDKDTYTFADLANTSGTVIGVMTTIYAAKTDAGARTARAVTRSGGADYGGADAVLSTTYTTYDEVRETNPATSSAWSIAAVNAAEFGFEARP